MARRWFSIAAGIALAAFVTAGGIPTLRHDWNWPIDRIAVASFLSDSTSGWLSVGFGIANPHPTTYLIGPPLAAVMWLLRAARRPRAARISHRILCARAAAAHLAALWGATAPVSIGIALFLSFNPWVYNEIVAGHLVMVLAYGAFIGHAGGDGAWRRRLARAACALNPRSSRAQLQFFILAMLALVVFARHARASGRLRSSAAIIVLPSAIGLIAERGMLLRIPVWRDLAGESIGASVARCLRWVATLRAIRTG